MNTAKEALHAGVEAEDILAAEPAVETVAPVIPFAALDTEPEVTVTSTSTTTSTTAAPSPASAFAAPAVITTAPDAEFNRQVFNRPRGRIRWREVGR